MRLFIVGFSLLLLFACGNSEPNRPYAHFRNYSRTFSDMNHKHLKIAKRQGIEPVEDEKEAKEKLEHIESCSLYAVDKLTHSLPYLTEQTKEVLEQIARNFKDSLAVKGLTDYHLVVTSLLRTKRGVKSLRNKNLNASRNSAHLYGTTFDIAYARFIKNGWGDEVKTELLKSNLADVLNDLRDRDGCYVKYEYKQGCFHITARKVIDD